MPDADERTVKHCLGPIGPLASLQWHGQNDIDFTPLVAAEAEAILGEKEIALGAVIREKTRPLAAHPMQAFAGFG